MNYLLYEFVQNGNGIALQNHYVPSYAELRDIRMYIIGLSPTPHETYGRADATEGVEYSHAADGREFVIVRADNPDALIGLMGNFATRSVRLSKASPKELIQLYGCAHAEESAPMGWPNSGGNDQFSIEAVEAELLKRMNHTPA